MTACAFCHGRRTVIATGYLPAAELSDYFDFELLDTDVYHPDGQVREEAFEWTSFEMSRMAARGVVCQDCHEPHGVRLRAEGNALCLRCHSAEVAEPAHTHHAATSRGAQCVNCHMPETVFMERDARRDHHLARPDPEGAAAVGAADACTKCHSREAQAWAAKWVVEWYGPSATVRTRRAWARALHRGQHGDASAVAGLRELLSTREAGSVRRASAARVLGDWTAEAGIVEALGVAAEDPDPKVRAGAVKSLGDGAAGDQLAMKTLLRASRDPIRLVRIEAAFGLRAVDVQSLAPEDRDAVENSFREWLSAQDVLAELPETNYNRGLFFTARGAVAEAERAYRTAIRLWPHDLAPRQNLALLLAGAGQPRDAEVEWKELLEEQPGWPPALFSLGLLHAEEGRWADAIAELENCLRGNPGYPRGWYNLGVTYAAQGRISEARAAFQRAAADPSSKVDALRELASLNLLQEDQDSAATGWRPHQFAADPPLGHVPR